MTSTLTTRALPVAIVAAVVLAFGAGFAIWLNDVSDDAEAGPTATAGPRAEAPRERGGGADRPAVTTPAKPAAPAGFDAASVEVAVLSGVGVPGAARRTGKVVTHEGFDLGRVGNAADPTAVSLVLYAPGQERGALAVSRRLKIPRRKPVDSRSARLGKRADVVVVVGGDRVR